MQIFEKFCRLWMQAQNAVRLRLGARASDRRAAFAAVFNVALCEQLERLSGDRQRVAEAVNSERLNTAAIGRCRHRRTAYLLAMSSGRVQAAADMAG